MLPLALGFLLFPLGRSLPDHVEQILLILLERFLAGGSFIVVGRRWTSGWANIRHLFCCAAIQRDRVKVVRPRECHTLFVVCKRWIAFDIVGLGDLPG